MWQACPLSLLHNDAIFWGWRVSLKANMVWRILLYLYLLRLRLKWWLFQFSLPCNISFNTSCITHTSGLQYKCVFCHFEYSIAFMSKAVENCKFVSLEHHISYLPQVMVVTQGYDIWCHSKPKMFYWQILFEKLLLSSGAFNILGLEWLIISLSKYHNSSSCISKCAD